MSESSRGLFQLCTSTRKLGFAAPARFMFRAQRKLPVHTTPLRQRCGPSPSRASWHDQSAEMACTTAVLTEEGMRGPTPRSSVWRRRCPRVASKQHWRSYAVPQQGEMALLVPRRRPGGVLESVIVCRPPNARSWFKWSPPVAELIAVRAGNRGTHPSSLHGITWNREPEAIGRLQRPSFTLGVIWWEPWGRGTAPTFFERER